MVSLEQFFGVKKEKPFKIYNFKTKDIPSNATFKIGEDNVLYYQKEKGGLFYIACVDLNDFTSRRFLRIADIPNLTNSEAEFIKGCINKADEYYMTFDSIKKVKCKGSSIYYQLEFKVEFRENRDEWKDVWRTFTGFPLKKDSFPNLALNVEYPVELFREMFDIKEK